METAMFVVFVGGLLLALFVIVFRSRSAIQVTDPALGFVNLAEDDFSALVEEDRAALAPLFSSFKLGTLSQIPSCDVLFLYATLNDDGSIGHDTRVTLRHLAEQAGASIAVLASNNPSQHVVRALQSAGPKKANLIWTLDRKGDAFARFFKALFTLMYSGKSMPMAWVAISPQRRGEAHEALPETICQMEAGQVKFRRARP